jgi:transposase-like protein
VLGLWVERTEGVNFGLKIFNEFLHDIVNAVVDGLRGYPDATEAVSTAQIQTCIVYLICNSLNRASWNDREPLAAPIRPSYQHAGASAAATAPEAFSQSECSCHPKHPAILLIRSTYCTERMSTRPILFAEFLRGFSSSS